MTTQSRHDVVIVGARCAGATLATFLARSGASVLLLDKDQLPSDQILSTHTIHPPYRSGLPPSGCTSRIPMVTSA
jgi:flavin-dependent dehydrogenase